ncbi:MAG TPA: DUF1697 domain-containing protein [Planctomycetota bacterium]
MNTYIALFRGINVGSAHILPMKELVALLEELGCVGVKTNIQSGNAVFRHRAAAPGLAKKIRAAVGAAKGFEPAVLLLTQERIARAAAANPFPEGEEDPSKLHLSFLAARPQQPDLATLEGLRANGERFALKDDVFYLYAPEGIGRSKLAAKVEKALGVPATARNWRTVQKVLELAAPAG